MKKIGKIGLIVIVLIFGMAMAKDILVKTSVEKGVELVTGLKLNIGSLRVGILKPITDIKNLNLLNPLEFHDKTMVTIPEIYVHYNLPAILTGKIYLPEVRLTLKEFVVVKNAQGKLNLDTFKNIRSEKKEKDPAQKKPSGKVPAIKIDTFTLNIGKVIYKDYSKGSTPEVKEFTLNLNETFTNIDNPYVLANLIILKALMNTTIASLTNFDLTGLEGSVGNVLPKMQKTVSQAASTAKEVGKKATDTLKGLF